MALTKKSSRSLQRQIDLTTAVCQERLLATHVRHVLALVDLVEEQVPFDDAVDIYVRILRLNTEQARNVASRALAELGRKNGFIEPRARPREEGPEEEEHEGGDEEASGRSGAIFSRLKRRIRGRVQEGLRERINLAAARTEDDLLETHVGNALLFVRALDEATASDAVETYLEIMMIPEGVADVIYHRALRVLADDVLPPLPDGQESDTAAPRSSVAAAEGAAE